MKATIASLFAYHELKRAYVDVDVDEAEAQAAACFQANANLPATLAPVQQRASRS